MTDYSQFMAEHVRIAILRMLDEAPAWQMNSSMLRDGLSAMGLGATGDQVRTQLAWLKEQGLLHLVEALPGLLVATATERGLDVAAGRATVPGVRRPSPKG
jgi:Fe2+ or Zn2+ uptake regulation protein